MLLNLKITFFWIKVTEEESKLLIEKYLLITTRTLKESSC